jgi:phosphoglycolate phosphatase
MGKTGEHSNLCFIFDLDGTLLDDIDVFRMIFTEKIPAYFHNPLSNTKKAALNEKAMDMVTGKSSKWLVLKGMWWLGAQLELSWINRFKMMQYLKKQYDQIIPYVPFFPGTIDALSQLKQKFPLALNTSSSRKELHDRFQHRSELLELFNGLIITRSDVKHLKPAPDGILQIAQSLHISPASCVMVGDMTVDLDAAKNAGAYSVLVLCGFLQQSDVAKLNLHPDLIANDVPDLVTKLPEIERALITK